MRCKQGELAVISYTTLPDFAGLFVTTVRLAQNGDFGLNWSAPHRLGEFWVVTFAAGRRPKYAHHDHCLPPTLGVWPDAWLRPIRDDGSLFDETMFWKCGTAKNNTLTALRSDMQDGFETFKREFRRARA